VISGSSPRARDGLHDVEKASAKRPRTAAATRKGWVSPPTAVYLGAKALIAQLLLGDKRAGVRMLGQEELVGEIVPAEEIAIIRGKIFQDIVQAAHVEFNGLPVKVPVNTPPDPKVVL